MRGVPGARLAGWGAYIRAMRAAKLMTQSPNYRLAVWFTSLATPQTEHLPGFLLKPKSAAIAVTLRSFMRVLEICRIFRRQSSQYAILACSLRNVSTICEGDTRNIVAFRS